MSDVVYNSDSRLWMPSRDEAIEISNRFSLALHDIGPNIGVHPCEPLRLSRAHYDTVASAAVGIVCMSKTALELWGTSTNDRAAYLGIDPSRMSYAFNDTYDLSYSDLMCRADIVLTSEGPKIIEFNTSGAVGGIVPCHQIAQALSDCGPTQSLIDNPGFIDPLDGLASAFSNICRQSMGRRDISMVASIRDVPGAGSARSFDIAIDTLRGKGLTPDLTLIEHCELDHILTNKRPLWLNYTPYEWNELGIDETPVIKAVAEGCSPLPSQGSYPLGDKRVLALLSEGLPWMTKAHHSFVQSFVPWTRIIGDRRTTHEGRFVDLLDFVIRNKDHLVIKHAEGLKSIDVWIGSRVSQEIWNTIVSSASDSGSYVVQAYANSIRFRTLLVDSAGDVVERMVEPIISPYVFRGLPGGMWARFVPDNPFRTIARRFGAVESIVVVGE